MGKRGVGVGVGYREGQLLEGSNIVWPSRGVIIYWQSEII